jgi:hypothetical protein
VLDGADPEGVLLVDVGGGLCHDVEKFALKYPSSRGRLVVQDPPSVIDEAKAQGKAGIEFIAYDFFQPQPVKGQPFCAVTNTSRTTLTLLEIGARAYYLHSVLHDWSDPKAVLILKNIAQACRRDYSKLLINESVITTTGSSPIATGLDIIVMSTFGGRERSGVDWKKLLDQAGFRVVTVYTDPLVSYESVIEAEVIGT